jgi:hypothetical protein
MILQHRGAIGDLDFAPSKVKNQAFIKDFASSSWFFASLATAFARKNTLHSVVPKEKQNLDHVKVSSGTFRT